ncbi:MAG TPA: Crp/Fnr family transcriptional regulator [Saprospiraceae bacterium]|nr:Crp/Fnr family transcriptional regulator [Saprospiraceae bacterium]HND88428.1 Crp/Fnr family transcriptional regulator [Saprospiraceae bacterium]
MSAFSPSDAGGLAQWLRRTFPTFDQSDLVDWLAQQGVCKEVPADAPLMQAGGLVRYIPLVLSGSVKVSREDAEGREIFLYYILPGETCAMTLSACYKGESSRINARTQEASTLLLLPAALVHEATRRFPAWQRFAFESFGYRYDELLHTLEGVVFQHLDERLHNYLLEKSAALHTRRLHISQQQIADDLHASREVVSRLIRQLERRGSLRHSRGVIEILSAM